MKPYPFNGRSMTYLAVLLITLAVSGCAGSKTEMPTNEGEGTDLMRKSPCVCEQLDFDGRGFTWLG